MLKQPSLFLTPSSPESTGRRYARTFARSSLALYNTMCDSSEAIHGEEKMSGDGDSSVSSLDSFTSMLDHDDFWSDQTSSGSPSPEAKMPGTVWEKKESSALQVPKVISTTKIVVDRKPTPVACHVTSLPSCSKRKRLQPLGKVSFCKEPFTFVVNDATAALDASVVSSTDVSSAEVQVVPVATPISATRVVPCCDLCDRKDAEIQKQLREIEQLKGLVTQLVTVLGQSLTQQLPPTVTKPQSPSPPQHHVESPKVESKEEGTQTAMPLPETTTDSASIPSTVEPEETSKELAPSTVGTASMIMDPNEKTRGTSQSTMLRLSRLKHFKEESSPAKPCSTRNKKRHVYVSVAGNWGYYCGPALEQNVSLQGCVVRFDNGDLYLGDMMCYVPSTSFFSDEHGLRFHGRGVLYRKDGTIVRGLFHKHQLIE